jgi:hypothetical protein
MIEFMVKVLASNLFWVGYALSSGVVTTIILRHELPHVLVWLTKDKKEARVYFQEYAAKEHIDTDEEICVDCFGLAIFVAALLMVLWPAYAALLLVYYLFWGTGKLISISFRAFFKAMDKIVPDVSVKVKTKEE